MVLALKWKTDFSFSSPLTFKAVRWRYLVFSPVFLKPQPFEHRSSCF